MIESYDELIDELRQYVPEDAKIELPPPIMAELDMRFIKYEAQKYLVCAFPAQRRFGNPMLVFQGGMAGAAFDVVFGAFAMLLTKKPCTTVTMETNFIRPLFAGGNDFTVDVRMRAVHSNFIFLEGYGKDHNAKLFATASCTMAPFKIREAGA